MDRCTGRTGLRVGRRGLPAASLSLALLLTGCSTSLPEGASTGAVSSAPGSPGVTSSVSPAQTVPDRPRDDVPLVGNPLAGHELFASPYTAAAEAAYQAEGTEEGALLARLAEVSTGFWLLPEVHPEGDVAHVADIAMQAQEVGKVPVFVVYGIPQRDCIHGYSEGGASVDGYLSWVQEIAENAGTGSIVVLEPDAIASVSSCRLDHDRLELLHDAVGILAAGPVTYVDAGHSAWIDAETIARRLDKVGVHRVRGFSLNVAGYGAEDGERVFGNRVSSLLGGSFFVVDTGRAGAGYDGSWCNPGGRAVGALPGPVDWGGAMDGRLWVKPPGESDGTCGGGPEAGEFWTERAVEMMRAAGW